MWTIAALRRGALQALMAAATLAAAAGGSCAADDALPAADVAVPGAEVVTRELQPLPEAVVKGLDSVVASISASNPALPAADAALLVRFVKTQGANGAVWKLPSRWSAQGACCMLVIPWPLGTYLEMNYHPGIPDHALFPASMRFSGVVSREQAVQAYERCTRAPVPAAHPAAVGRYASVEEIAPNPESGAYFVYTNLRTLARCTLDGSDALFSYGELIPPSSSSKRGVMVGPEDRALFYYSEKPGVNLPGLAWARSQIVLSKSLGVYVSIGPAQTVLAFFTWLDAGWKGVNLTRATHIVHTQQTLLDFIGRLARNPAVTPKRIAAVVAGVATAPQKTIDAEYGRYVTYVKAWRDNGRGGFFSRNSLLASLYDQDVLSRTHDRLRRAIIVQERMRCLLGTPTWSAYTAGADLTMNR